jgi:hypothetical protein
MPHSHHLIFPYRTTEHLLVFDDAERHLYREELCRGADTLWDRLTSVEPLANALMFSTHRIPLKASAELIYHATEPDGWHFYTCYAFGPYLEVRLCPSLLLYFPTPPTVIYAAAGATDQISQPSVPSP